MNKKTMKALLTVVVEVRKVDPEMQMQTFETLLRIALNEGVPMAQLQQETKVSLSATSRNVGILSRVNVKGAKALGFCEAHEDPMDRRRKVVYMTPKGKTFIDKLNTALEV